MPVQQLRQPSQALLKAALAALDQCVAVLEGSELRYTFANAAYERAAPSSPVVGRRYRDVFTGDAVAGAEAKLLHVLETGEPWHVDTYQAPGTPSSSLWEGEVVRTQAPGEPPAILIIARDVTERTRMERALLSTDEALRQANEKLRKTLDGITDGAAVIDAVDARFRFVSDRAAQILKVRPQDLLGRSAWEMFPRARGTKFEQGYDAAQQTGQPQHFEEYYPEPLDAWLECHVYPSDGEHTIYFRDVTARRTSDAALRQSEARFRALVNATSDFVYSASPDWTVMRAIRGGDLAGEERPMDAWVRQYIEPEDWARIKAANEEAIRTHGTFALEHRYKRPDGTHGWVLSRAVPLLDGRGDVAEWIGMATDVTDRHRAEDALRFSEARFRGTFENAAVGMAHLSLEGRWLRVNDAMCRIVGFPLIELAGRPFTEIVHPDDRHAHEQHAARLLNGEIRSYKLEKRFLRRDGSWVWCNVTVTLAAEATAGERYFIAVIEDMNARRATEEQLAEALRVRDDFLSIAGHELKTPLATLLLQVETLARAVRRNPRVPNMAQRLQRAAESGLRLDKLVNQLLDVSRITTGHLQLERQVVNVGALMHTVVDRFEEIAARAGCPLRVHIDPHVVGLVDPSRVEQIATNLLSNAFKYGKGALVEIELESRRDLVVLQVIDHGIGIAPEQQHRIFERFERAVAGREYGGLGLGLWIARQLAVQMGGTIAVESTVGGGSTFEVELPLFQPLAGEHAIH
jgi:PAS domain S-box-containing protein